MISNQYYRFLFAIVLTLLCINSAFAEVNIQVLYPKNEGEVTHIIKAKGAVTIGESDNIPLDDLYIVAFTRSAISFKYVLQENTKHLKFKKDKANWNIDVNVGEVRDYGGKYFLQLFVVTNKMKSRLESLTKKQGSINLEIFERDFLNISDNYFVRSEQITMFRAFPNKK